MLCLKHQQLLQSYHIMMSKTILIPSDFSNNALVATRYALDLAKQLGANLHILHAYSSFNSAFQSQSVNETDATRAQSDAENNMGEFLGKVGDSKNVTITTSLLKDSLTDAVEAYLNTNTTVCLMIMGTHGASGTRKDILGSNTYDIAKSVNIPLLIVPEHASSFHLERVAFFTDYQNQDIATLQSLKNLLDGQELPCTLVHITQLKDSSLQEQVALLSNWSKKLSQTVGYANLNTELVSNKEDITIVDTALDRLSADLCLLTVVGGRSFFEKLFHKSLAREIILNPKVPVLLTSGHR